MIHRYWQKRLPVFQNFVLQDLPNGNDSDSDCLSDSCSDSGTDWEQAWTDSLQARLEDSQLQVELASNQEGEGCQPDGDKIGSHHKERIICDFNDLQKNKGDNVAK